MLPGTSAALDSALSYLYGDTFRGAPFVIKESGSPPSSNLASVTMFIKEHRESLDVIKELTSSGGDITIDSAANWELTIESANLGLKPGKYFYGIRCTDADGVVTTYVTGTLEILQS